MIKFTFKDKSIAYREIGENFRGIKHKGKRPIEANILIREGIRFSIIKELADEILLSLDKQSLHDCKNKYDNILITKRENI